MSPNKPLQDLFNAAMERQDAAERARFLDDACGADAALRERVEKLLRAHEEIGGFMAQPSRKPPGLDGSQTGRGVPLTEKPGDLIGRYKLLQQIGEGGCGVVYMAEQEEPVRRRVALKVIKLGMDTKQVIARFEAERQALALMDHPNIAKVLDAGATETGRPYFVMELVRGTRITEFCDQKALSTRERLGLFLQVCSAVQHAHQKGIIHRDLKPSNLLVTVIDGVPVPKVIDFGIAKATNNQRLTDKTVFTAFEQFIGTPAYMSPEQAELSGVDIDTRTDIYSLGVVLYELLTGGPPFDQKELLAAGLDEMRRTIREVEPAKPSTRLTQALAAADVSPLKSNPESARNVRADSRRLLQEVKGDLDWIALKCLEKNRARRYETANALAADIRRHLDCEPVVARPPSRWYEFQKTVRRHKFGFAAAAAVMTALAIGFAVSTWQFMQKNLAYQRASSAEQEQIRLRQQAEASQKKAETEAAKSQQVARFFQEMLKSAGPSVASGRDATLLKEILDRTAERLGEELTDEPEVEAELRSTIGFVYFEFSDFEKSQSMYRRALQLMQTVRSVDDVAVADLLFRLAEAYRKGSQPNAATEAAQEALAIYKREHGPEAPSVGALLNLLGGVIKDSNQGNIRDAEAMLREALAMNRKLLEADHPQVGLSLSRLGGTLRSMGRLTEADSVLEEAVRVQRKALGGGQILGLASPYVELGWTLNTLGLVQRDQGRLAEAEATSREAVAMMRTVLAWEHDDAMQATATLVETLRRQSKFAEITSLRREELVRQKQIHGETHRAVGLALDNLARFLEAEGQLDEAESLCREELAVERRLSGNDHPYVANSLRDLARVLTKQGRMADAEMALQEGSEIRRKSLGSEHDDTKFMLAWLGLTQQVLGKDSEAVAFLKEELDHARAADGKCWASTNSGLGVVLHHFAEYLLVHKAFKEARPPAEQAWTLFQQHLDWPENERMHADQVLQAVLTGLNDHAALESLQRDELVRLRAKFPAEHPELANALARLVLHCLVQQEFTEAEAPAREALAIREKVTPHDWRTFNSRSQLGGSLLGQKKYAEAEPFLLSGYEGMKQREQSIPAAAKVRIKEAIERLAQLYEATSQPERAAEWNKKLAKSKQTEAKK